MSKNQNELNYLAIGSQVDRFVLALFNGKKLVKYGNFPFTSFNVGNMLAEFYDRLYEIIDEKKVDVVVVKWFDYYRIERKKAFDLISYRTVIKLACSKLGVTYVEADTYGFEKYMTEITKESKIDIINKAYGLDLKVNKDFIIKDGEEVANTIMLGEAMAHQRIGKENRQYIQYKWGW